MIVGYGRARTTRDVDARIEYAKDEVLAAAEEIAAERNFATGSGSDPRVFGACQRQRPRSIPARLVVVPLDVALVDLDAVGVDVLRPAVVRHRGGVLDVEHDPPDFVRRPAGAPRRRTAGVALDPALNQADGSHPNETATVGLRSSRGRRQGTASTPRGARWPVGGAVPQRAGVAAPCAGGASIPASTTTALAPCAGRMIASGAAVIERMSPRRRPSLAPSASTTTCARHASAPATHPAASAAVVPARAVVVTSARTRSWPFRATICAMLDPRIVTTIGLGLDIVGIVLLYWYGAIGGEWIDAPKREPLRRRKLSVKDLQRVNPVWKMLERLLDQAVAGNERRARLGSRWGLGLAATGFGLQAVAQWL